MTDSRPYVFVLGTGRCGSTLVHEWLARHPDVGFVSNVDDRSGRLNLSGRWNNELYQLVPPRLTRKGRIRFAPSEAYRILHRQVSPSLCEPPRDLIASDASPWLTAKVRTFFDERHDAQGKPVFVHKFTGWSRAGFLREIFPQAKFVHIYRDGRAVANSFVQMRWWSGHRGPDLWRWGPLSDDDRRSWEVSGRSLPVLAAIEWGMLIDALMAAESATPDEQWLSVGYEDLVADPHHRLNEILGFSGLDDAAVFWDRVSHNAPTSGRVSAYRNDLLAKDIEDIEAVVGDRLSALGYELG